MYYTWRREVEQRGKFNAITKRFWFQNVNKINDNNQKLFIEHHKVNHLWIYAISIGMKFQNEYKSGWTWGPFISKKHSISGWWSNHKNKLFSTVELLKEWCDGNGFLSEPWLYRVVIYIRLSTFHSFHSKFAIVWFGHEFVGIFPIKMKSCGKYIAVADITTTTRNEIDVNSMAKKKSSSKNQMNQD